MGAMADPVVIASRAPQYIIKAAPGHAANMAAQKFLAVGRGVRLRHPPGQSNRTDRNAQWSARTETVFGSG
jgi:hypothetical protein